MSALRNLVRALVGAALCVAVAACAALPVPKDLPAIALEQAALYRLEVALAAFYGCLLLATPTYSGLVQGRLPIEISTRGAKFAGEADQTVERDEATIEKLEQGMAALDAGLSEAQIEIDLLKTTSGDKT
jgi:hypothetical protein